MTWTPVTVAVMLAAAMGLPGGSVGVQLPKRPALQAVDHLLLGVSDLDAGIAWVEALTGVKGVVGGSHPGVGTRNALLSLGGRHYLEIIAPDPAQAAFNYRVDLRAFKEPRLIGWAASATNIEDVAAAVRSGGQEALGPRDGARARPDGRMLRWKTLGLPTDLVADGFDPIPFFIEWAAGTVHPSDDAPKGCALEAIEIQHPRAPEVAAVLGRAGIDAVVGPGDARLAATLQCPKGRVVVR